MNTTWTVELPKFKSLQENKDVDVCIIGGGIAGIWAAYLLGKAGKKVILLEKKTMCSGTTSYTTAFITQVIDTPLTELVKVYGKRKAQMIWDSGSQAIDLIEATIVNEKIDCEFMRIPYTIYALEKEELKDLKEESDTAKALGFKTRMTPKVKGFKNSGTLQVLKQAKYHPLKFLRGVLNAMPTNVEIYENSEVVKITGNSLKMVTLKNGKRIKAQNIITATYEPFNKPKQVRFKQGMYTSYIFELQVKKGSIPIGIHSDTLNPYQYFRVDSLDTKHDRLIVGGEDHRVELNGVLGKKSFKALKEYVENIFPGLDYSLVKRWRGGILEPSDGIAVIGEYEPGKFITTAFSGNGMTYAPISGMLLTDLILKKKNPWVKIYDPKRTLLTKALVMKGKDYMGEFLGGAGKNLFK